MRNKLQLVTAFGCVVFGLGLIALAMITEPTGEIHYSVLVAYGETLTFAGSLLGLDYHYRVRK